MKPTEADDVEYATEDLVRSGFQVRLFQMRLVGGIGIVRQALDHRFTSGSRYDLAGGIDGVAVAEFPCHGGGSQAVRPFFHRLEILVLTSSSAVQYLHLGFRRRISSAASRRISLGATVNV